MESYGTMLNYLAAVHTLGDEDDDEGFTEQEAEERLP
jgi:hypothetical protein